MQTSLGCKRTRTLLSFATTIAPNIKLDIDLASAIELRESQMKSLEEEQL